MIVLTLLLFLSLSSRARAFCSGKEHSDTSLTIRCQPKCRLKVTFGKLDKNGRYLESIKQEPDCRDIVPLHVWKHQHGEPLIDLHCAAYFKTRHLPSMPGVAREIYNPERGLMMTDPDEPNCANLTAKYKLYWLVMDVKVDRPFLKGENWINELPPTPSPPPHGSPPYHRYQFTLFEYSGIKSRVTNVEGHIRRILAENEGRKRRTVMSRIASLFYDFKVVAQTEIRTKFEKEKSKKSKKFMKFTRNAAGALKWPSSKLIFLILVLFHYH